MSRRSRRRTRRFPTPSRASAASSRTKSTSRFTIHSSLVASCSCRFASSLCKRDDITGGVFPFTEYKPQLFGTLHSSQLVPAWLTLSLTEVCLLVSVPRSGPASEGVQDEQRGIHAVDRRRLGRGEHHQPLVSLAVLPGSVSECVVLSCCFVVLVSLRHSTCLVCACIHHCLGFVFSTAPRAPAAASSTFRSTAASWSRR